MIVNIFQMKDLFTEFKKQNAKKHVAIAVCAFAFAIGVNAFLMGTDTGVKLQASAVEYAGKKESTSADLMLVNAGSGTDMVKLRLTHDASKVSEIQATVLFDPASLKITNLENDENKNVEIAKVSNIDGVALVMVRFKQPQDVLANTDLFSVTFERKGKSKTPINLASTQLISEGAAYELTSEGTEF